VCRCNDLFERTTEGDKALKSFYDLHPENYQRKHANEIAITQLKIKERAADGCLSKLLSRKLLDNPRSGSTKKLKSKKDFAKFAYRIYRFRFFFTIFVVLSVLKYNSL
jgi:hypothetical protein